jgi:hypothetical protein
MVSLTVGRELLGADHRVIKGYLELVVFVQFPQVTKTLMPTKLFADFIVPVEESFSTLFV